MIHIKTYILAFFIFFFTNCADEANKNDSLFQIHPGKKTLEIPGINSNNLHHIQKIKEADNSEYLVLFNEHSGRLFMASWLHGKIMDEVQFYSDGPNGLGNLYKTGFLFHNRDSIYFYSAFGYTLSLADINGKVKTRYKIASKEIETNNAYPDVRTTKPIFKVGPNIYLNCLKLGIEFIEDHTQLGNVIIINESNGEVEYSAQVKRDSIYNNGLWGLKRQYELYSCYNPKTGLFTYSFGLDHYLHITDHKSVLKKIKVRSRFIPEELFPASEEKVFSPRKVSKEHLQEFDYSNPAYYAIYYDEYRDVYYRFMRLGWSKEERYDHRPQRYAVSVIDKDFNLIGEEELPNTGYQFTNMFVDEKGLWIQESDIRNEDRASFSLFSLKM